MSFYAVAVGVVGEGVAAGILGGAMMGATATVAGNVVGGRDPFDNIGRGVVMGGLTGGLTPGVAQAFEIGMPAAAGITSFGLNTLATGDLGKGLVAGATAYGLYGVSENMEAAGNYESALSSNALNAELAKAQGLTEGLSSGDAFNKFLTSDANPAVSEVLKNATPFDRVSAGFDAAKANPSAFFKDNAKNLMYTAGSVLADAGVKSNMPTTTTRPGAVRRFSYDPYGQLYTPIGNYEVPVKAAGGGLMGMNDGGYNPGQLNFAQQSEPVVRMASGGIAGYAMGGMPNMREFMEATGVTDPNEASNLLYGVVGSNKDTRDWGSIMSSADPVAAAKAATAQMYTSPTGNAGYIKLDETGTGGMLYSGSGVPLTSDLSRAAEFGISPINATGGGAAAVTNNAATNNTAVTANNAATNNTAGTNLAAFNNSYTGANINDYIANNQLDAAGIAAAAKTFNVDPAQITAAQNAQQTVTNVYRNVLGRDPDPNGLAWWTNQIMNGDRTGAEMYEEFKKSAKSLLGTDGTKELFKDLSLADAVKDTSSTVYQSADKRTIADEWVRNTLGREVTDADRKTQWYKDAANSGVMTTVGKAEDIYGKFKDFARNDAGATVAKQIADAKATLAQNGLTEADVLRQTGKTIAELVGSGIKLENNIFKASQLLKPGQKAGFDFNTITKPKVGTTGTTGTASTASTSVTPAGFYGNDTGNALTRTPGDITTNKDGTVTVQPNIPGRPTGGFPGMAAVKDAYVEGGGSLGYIPYAPKTIEEFNTKYNTLTGGSKEAYDYLTGKTKYSATPYTETGEVMKPYSESVLGVPRSLSSKKVLFDPVTKKYRNNPDYIPVSYTDKGEKVYGLSSKDIAAQLPDVATSDYEKWMKDNNVTLAQIAEALGISLAEAKKRYPLAGGKVVTTTDDAGGGGSNSTTFEGGGGGEAAGGLMAMAGGGMAGQFNLGGYSDGGRLLRGPGDGVSDSIPATIGNKRPARLADGEFVVPARIVSELGNGSTEAGARKLYAMMDRVQAARRGSIGKGKVAKNSRADKYLPA